MDLVTAVVAARKAMEPLINDKKAKAGAYSFNYASLTALLDVVVPALAEQGVLLIQDVSGDAKSASVQTILMGAKDNEGDRLYFNPLKSGLLTLSHDGTAQAMGKAITTLRRYQLKSFLGLESEDEDAAAPESTPIRGQPQTQQRTTPVLAGAPPQGTRNARGGEQGTPQEVQRATPAPREIAPASGLDLLRGAARKGQVGLASSSPELQALVLRVRNEDAKDGEEMATKPADGKKVSMYDYMKDTVLGGVVGKGNSELVLSFLYGRIVNSEFPPHSSTRFFFDEVAAGSHKTPLGEVRTRLTTS